MDREEEGNMARNEEGKIGTGSRGAMRERKRKREKRERERGRA
jgi:hypothetical protein